MRIALIICSNLCVSPYVQYYVEILERLGVQYDIISWNRLGVDEIGVQAFNLRSNENKGIFGKFKDYIHYQKFVKSKLTEGCYDKVVIFTIQMTLMLFLFLKTHYQKKYVFDIRDYSFTLKYFGARFSAAINNSAFVVISSNGFKQWLPKEGEYVIRHNTCISRPIKMLAETQRQIKHKILTIGSLRDCKVNRYLIEQLRNSPVFELEYVGSGPAEPLLKEFVTSSEIENVKFFGRYLKEDEPKYLRGASLISILTNEDINSVTLMSNRFYLSLVYGIPMMVYSGTEQANWVKRYNLGIIIDKNSDLKQQLVQYLQTFSSEKFDAGRKACLQVVWQDNNEFEEKFKQFLCQ